MRRALFALAAMALSSAVPAQDPDTVAIGGGTILTVTHGTIASGVIVAVDGKITAVGGPDTPIPDGASVIDTTGQWVMPGIIDAHSHIAAESINEGQRIRLVDDRHRRRPRSNRHQYLSRARRRSHDVEPTCTAAPTPSGGRTPSSSIGGGKSADELLLEGGASGHQVRPR